MGGAEDGFRGRVQLTFDTVAASIPQVSAGKLNPIAVTTGRRFEALPNVPTFAEAGLAGFDLASWNALMAPRGTPREVIDLIDGHVNAILGEPEIRKRLTELGIQPMTGTPEQLAAFVRTEAQ